MLTILQCSLAHTHAHTLVYTHMHLYCIILTYIHIQYTYIHANLHSYSTRVYMYTFTHTFTYNTLCTQYTPTHSIYAYVHTQYQLLGSTSFNSQTSTFLTAIAPAAHWPSEIVVKSRNTGAPPSWQILHSPSLLCLILSRLELHAATVQKQPRHFVFASLVHAPALCRHDPQRPENNQCVSNNESA